MAAASCAGDIILMIILSRIEGFRGFNFRHDSPPFVFGRLLKLSDETFGFGTLLIVHHPNPRSILIADVRPLATLLGWIVHFEKCFEQLAETNALGIVYHFDRFSVAG